jgi:hypothetical protein
VRFCYRARARARVRARLLKLAYHPFLAPLSRTLKTGPGQQDRDRDLRDLRDKQDRDRDQDRDTQDRDTLNQYIQDRNRRETTALSIEGIRLNYH